MRPTYIPAGNDDGGGGKPVLTVVRRPENHSHPPVAISSMLSRFTQSLMLGIVKPSAADWANFAAASNDLAKAHAMNSRPSTAPATNSSPPPLLACRAIAMPRPYPGLGRVGK